MLQTELGKLQRISAHAEEEYNPNYFTSRKEVYEFWCGHLMYCCDLRLNLYFPMTASSQQQPNGLPT